MKSNKEIERKFLVNPLWFSSNLKKLPIYHITQGYLTLEKKYHTRIRITKHKNVSKATITSKLGSGIVRTEFEESISLSHAKVLMSRCLKVLKKERRKIKFKGFVWEIDYYPDHGFVVAEIELPSKTTKFECPPWVVKEISGNKKYSNIQLAVKQPRRRK